MSEARSTHRNGYRPRPWATRASEIELPTPYQKAQLVYFEAIRRDRLGSSPETKQALAEATKALQDEVRKMRLQQ